MAEFNVLLEKGVLRQSDDGRYTIDYAAMPAAIASLTEKLLTFEAQGDRAGVEAWFAKYDVLPPSLAKAPRNHQRYSRGHYAGVRAFSRGTMPCCGTPSALRSVLTLQHHDAAHRLPGTIIVPASDFFAAIPAGDSNDGRFPAGVGSSTTTPST